MGNGVGFIYVFFIFFVVFIGIEFVNGVGLCSYVLGFCKFFLWE